MPGGGRRGRVGLVLVLSPASDTEAVGSGFGLAIGLGEAVSLLEEVCVGVGVAADVGVGVGVGGGAGFGLATLARGGAFRGGGGLPRSPLGLVGSVGFGARVGLAPGRTGLALLPGDTRGLGWGFGAAVGLALG